jgi:plastocyanin
MKALRRPATLVTSLTVLTVAAAAGSTRAEAGYTAKPVTNGGTITGVVRFDGPRPTREQMEVATKEDVCHRDPIYSQKLVVTSENTVRWAVISIKEIHEGKPFPDYDDKDVKRPALDQAGCVYRPHVVIVPRGENLRLLNSDGVLHNVHTWPRKNRSKNLAMPGAIKEMKIRFRRPERIRTTCDIHAWMEAWIVVTEHPYYDVSDEKGAFKLTAVPPGTYLLHLWHETLGELEQTVTVEPNAETRVEFTLRQGK